MHLLTHWPVARSQAQVQLAEGGGTSPWHSTPTSPFPGGSRSRRRRSRGSGGSGEGRWLPAMAASLNPTAD